MKGMCLIQIHINLSFPVRSLSSPSSPAAPIEPVSVVRLGQQRMTVGGFRSLQSKRHTESADDSTSFSAGRSSPKHQLFNDACKHPTAQHSKAPPVLAAIEMLGLCNSAPGIDKPCPPLPTPFRPLMQLLLRMRPKECPQVWPPRL